MTPEQVKVYIDTILYHHDKWVLSLLALTVVASGMLAYMGGYIREKAKNTATRQDIARITSEVERAKSEFAGKLERLKTDLASRSHYSKLRYEREMKIYEDLWPKVSELRDAVLQLRPFIEMVNPEESDDQRKLKKAKVYAEKQQIVNAVVEKNRPFYPPEIWGEIMSLTKLCMSEAKDYAFLDPKADVVAYARQADENMQAIRVQIDKICEAIRARLAKFDES